MNKWLFYSFQGDSAKISFNHLNGDNFIGEWVQSELFLKVEWKAEVHFVKNVTFERI